MRFQISSAGFAAAFQASNQSPGMGPAIKISKFTVGSASGYSPVVSDDKLRGTELFSGTPIGYRVVDANTCEFTIRMEETIGTWQFGEIALWMPDGTMFALGALQRPQWKAAYPDQDFNRYNVKIRLILNGVIPKIELISQTIVAGTIWELPSVDDLPLLEDAATNVYLCHSKDEYGNEALCTKGDTRWTINTHLTKRFSGAVLAVDPTGKLVSSAALNISDNTMGRYVIQITEGIDKGSVRRLARISNGVAELLNSNLNIQVGDQFDVYSTTAGGGGGGGGDDGFFFALLGR